MTVPTPRSAAWLTLRKGFNANSLGFCVQCAPDVRPSSSVQTSRICVLQGHESVRVRKLSSLHAVGTGTWGRCRLPFEGSASNKKDGACLTSPRAVHHLPTRRRSTAERCSPERHSPQKSHATPNPQLGHHETSISARAHSEAAKTEEATALSSSQDRPFLLQKLDELHAWLELLLTSPWFGHAWPRALLIVVALLWGTNFACVKLVGETMQPADGAFARFSIAAMSLAPALLRGPRRKPVSNGSSPAPSSTIGNEYQPPLPGRLGVHGVVCGAWLFLGYMTQSISLQSTDAGKAAFIYALAVVFVPAMVAMFPSLSPQGQSGGKQGQPPWAATLLALAGVACMELSGSSVKLQAGDFWALGQAVGFGMGAIENERALAEFPEHAVQISAVQVGTVGVLSAIWSIVGSYARTGSVGLPDLSALTGATMEPAVLGAVAYTGLITTALTILLQTIALVRVSASETALILTMEPLFATVFAAVLLRESIGPETVLGGALITSACLVNQFDVPQIRLNVVSMLSRIVLAEEKPGR